MRNGFAILSPSVRGVRAYLMAVVSVAAFTSLGALISYVLHYNVANVAMILLLGVLVIAMYTQRGPAVFASILSVAAFNFVFVEPRFTFAVSDSQYIITFFVMLVVALVITTLTSRIREDAESARERERITKVLLALAAELSDAADDLEILKIARKHIAGILVGTLDIHRVDRERSAERALPEGISETEWRQIEKALTSATTIVDLESALMPEIFAPLIVADRCIGVLVLYGNRMPRGLRIFLLTLAIVDDILAVIVIAMF